MEKPILPMKRKLLSPKGAEKVRAYLSLRLEKRGWGKVLYTGVDNNFFALSPDDLDILIKPYDSIYPLQTMFEASVKVGLPIPQPPGLDQIIDLLLDPGTQTKLLLVCLQSHPNLVFICRHWNQFLLPGSPANEAMRRYKPTDHFFSRIKRLILGEEVTRKEREDLYRYFLPAKEEVKNKFLSLLLLQYRK